MTEQIKEEPVKYRFARVNYKSGNHKDFILTQMEILNLSTAVTLVDRLTDGGYESFTLFYDSDLAEEKRRISTVIRLKEVEDVDFGDKEFVLEDLQFIDYKNLQLWKEVGYFKKKWIKFQIWLKNKKQQKIKPKRGRRKKNVQ